MISANLAYVQSEAARAGFISRTYTNSVSKISFTSKTHSYSGVNTSSSRDFIEILVKTDSISSQNLP